MCYYCISKVVYYMQIFKIKNALSLLLAALVMVLLNFIIFLGVYSNNPQTFNVVLNSLYASFAIYFFFLLLCAISLALGRKKIIRVSFYILLTFMTLHIFFNLLSLVASSNANENGSAILFDALLIWLSSIMTFTIWYWIIDKQSSGGETLDDHRESFDFLFPQNQTPVKMDKDWKPSLVDYFSLSFFTSTSFAPADTLPITKRARLLMMCEALISLVIIGMVAARAISLIK